MAISKIVYKESPEAPPVTWMDATTATAAAADIMAPKTAMLADGVMTTGTGSGGGSVTVESLNVTQNGTYTAPTGKAYSPVTVNVSGGGGGGGSWVRPADWPDLSKMDVSGGDILYMTSYADEARGFCSFKITCTGNYTVEVGTISGSTFTANSTQTYASNSDCELYYGSANGTYKVLRVTGTAITKLTLNQGSTITIGSFYGYKSNQGIIDIVGKLPSGTGLSCSSQYNLVNVKIDGLVLSGSMSQMFYNCYSLTSLDVSGWDTAAVTSMSQMFFFCVSLTSLDVSGWDTGAVTDMNSMFSSCYSLTSLDVSDWDTGAVTNMSQMFNNCTSLTSLDVSDWDFSLVTNATYAGNIFRYCRGLRGSLTLPATMAQIGTYCFADMRSIYEWHFKATSPPALANTNAFSYMTDFGGKKIYVPQSALSAYKTATNWSTYASYMVGE